MAVLAEVDLLVAEWPGDSISTRFAAQILGVTHTTVSRWCHHVYGPIGSGMRYRVTREDLLVFSSWRHINGDTGAMGAGMGTLPVKRQLCDLAEPAIRRYPARWLALSPEWTATFSTAEGAADAWWQMPSPRPAVTFIDLAVQQ